MFVRDGSAVFNLYDVALGFVMIDLVFLHGVLDFYRIFLKACLRSYKLRQILELHGVGAITVIRHGLGHRRNDFHFFIACHQVYAVRVFLCGRTISVVVVIVFPDLRDGFFYYVYGVLHFVQGELMIIAHLDRRGIAAVHDFTFFAFFDRSYERAFQNLHGQLHCAALSGRCIDGPCCKATCLLTGMNRCRNCRYELYVRIQLILNDYFSCFLLVVHPADFISDFVADLDFTKYVGTNIRRNLLLLGYFRYRVLNNFKTVLRVIADLDGCSISAVDNLARAAIGLKCAFQHLDRQRYFAFRSGRYVLKFPCDGVRSFIIFSARIAFCICRRYILDIFVKLIVNDNFRCLTLVVSEGDLVGDLVSYLHTAQFADAFVRSDLFLMRNLRYRVLDFFHTVLMIVADLNRCGLTAVDNLARAVIGLLSTFQNHHSQSYFARFSSRYIRDRPVNLMILLNISSVIVCSLKLYVRIQCILDLYIRIFRLVVLVADLISDLISDLDAAEHAGAFVRSDFLLLRYFRYRVLNQFQTVLRVITNLHCCSFTAVDNLALATLGFKCAFQHLDRQNDSSVLTGRYVCNGPVHNMVLCIIYSAVACRYELNMFVKCILDYNIGFLGLVVLVGNFISDLISDLDTAKCADAFIRSDLLLMRYFRYRILDFFHMVLMIVSDLDRCGIAAVLDAAGAAVGCLCTRQYLDGQGHKSGFFGRYFSDFPGDDMCALVMCSIIAGGDILNIRIQRILDDYLRRHVLIVRVGNLIGNLFANLYTAKLAGSRIRSDLFFMRSLRYRVLNFFHMVFRVVADLHRSGIAAVDNLTRASLRLQSTFKDFHLQGYLAFCIGRYILQCPYNVMFHTIIAAVVVCFDEIDICIEFIGDDNIYCCILVILIRDLIGDNIAYLYTVKFAGAFVRADLSLMRLFRNRVLNDFYVTFHIVADLDSGGRSAVDNFTFTAVGFKSALKNLHGQSYFTLCSGRYLRNCPNSYGLTSLIRDGFKGTLYSIRLHNALRNKLDILVQRILDDHVSRFVFSVLEADLISDLILRIYRFKFTGTLERSHFFLMRFILITVHKFGEEDQNGAVFLSLLNSFSRSFIPVSRNNTLNPSVRVPISICIHLIHAGCDIRPVVCFFQFNINLTVHIVPVSFHCSFRIFCCTLQRNLQSKVIICRVRFSVNQPLLRHSDAVLAAGVCIYDTGFCCSSIGYRCTVIRSGQIFHEDHAAHIAKSRCVICNRSTSLVRNLSYGILANRQIRNIQCRTRLNLEYMSFLRLREIGFLRQFTIIAGHPVGHTIDYAGYLHIEGLARIISGLICTVYKYTLIDSQITFRTGICERCFADISRNRSV